MKWNCRLRCTLASFGFIALFSVFSFRLIYLQMLKHQEYVEKAARIHEIRQTIYAERGAIFDANQEVLAHNVPVRTAVADCSRLTNLDATVALVSAELKLPASEVSEKLGSDRKYVVLKREVPV